MEIKLSVRKLVEFIMSSGSIDNRSTGAGMDRALEGSRIHRQLQKKGGENYQAEVFLSLTTEMNELVFIIEGRADGIIEEEDRVIIDEIKTTDTPIEIIDENFNPLHWAQAMCYGYIYCVNNELEDILVQLTYYNIHTEEIKKLHNNYTVKELEVFYLNLLSQYRRWAEFQMEWSEVRNDSIKELGFPYKTYRQGQRELAIATYRTITNSGKLFCEAPTGIGKTMSTLFPAVKSMGEGEAEKIFYLTAKTITRQVAEEAIEEMRKQELKIKTVTLTAKDKVCFLEERDCNPDKCPYADGYYDRVNDAVFELLQSNDNFTREIIEQAAKKYQLCPFELALDLTWWCDCIICDYNYLFDPNVYLKRFFSDNKGEYVFLVDEVHNLVDRSKEMYSAELHKTSFLDLKKQFGKGNKKLTSSLTKINAAMVQFRKLCEGNGYVVQAEAMEEFNGLLFRFMEKCKEWLQENPFSEFEPEVLKLYFDCRKYLKITEFYDERYVTFIKAHDREVVVKQLCLNPTYLLNQAMKRGKASVLFSATLSPINYYMDILGGDEESKIYTLPSPFAQENAKLLVTEFISTKYHHRQASLEPIADALFTLVNGKKGNYLIFFPSYKYMNEAYEVFHEKYPDIETIMQSNQMDEQEREDFIEKFQGDNPNSLVGFCVLGGIFSEGIDLKGDRLVGTAIVGVGLPQLDTERNILKDYYQQENRMGYQFAYQFPGMNKVLQAAGRVIRGEADKGVILLIDDRFVSKTYQYLYPEHWSHFRVVRNMGELRSEIEWFWQGKV